MCGNIEKEVKRENSKEGKKKWGFEPPNFYEVHNNENSDP